MVLPASLGFDTGLSPVQRTTNIATGGALGGSQFRDPKVFNYFLELLETRLTDDQGNITNENLRQVLKPIEIQFIEQMTGQPISSASALFSQLGVDISSGAIRSGDIRRGLSSSLGTFGGNFDAGAFGDGGDAQRDSATASGRLGRTSAPSVGDLAGLKGITAAVTGAIPGLGPAFGIANLGAQVASGFGRLGRFGVVDQTSFSPRIGTPAFDNQVDIGNRAAARDAALDAGTLDMGGATAARQRARAERGNLGGSEGPSSGGSQTGSPGSPGAAGPAGNRAERDREGRDGPSGGGQTGQGGGPSGRFYMGGLVDEPYAYGGLIDRGYAHGGQISEGIGMALNDLGGGDPGGLPGGGVPPGGGVDPSFTPPAGVGPDDVSITAQNGEFVVAKPAVDAMGADFFNVLNDAFMKNPALDPKAVIKAAMTMIPKPETATPTQPGDLGAQIGAAIPAPGGPFSSGGLIGAKPIRA